MPASRKRQIALWIVVLLVLLLARPTVRLLRHVGCELWAAQFRMQYGKTKERFKRLQTLLEEEYRACGSLPPPVDVLVLPDSVIDKAGDASLDPFSPAWRPFRNPSPDQYLPLGYATANDWVVLVGRGPNHVFEVSFDVMMHRYPQDTEGLRAYLEKKVVRFWNDGGASGDIIVIGRRNEQNVWKWELVD